MPTTIHTPPNKACMERLHQHSSLGSNSFYDSWAANSMKFNSAALSFFLDISPSVMQYSKCSSLRQNSFVINITLRLYRLIINRYNVIFPYWPGQLTVYRDCLPRNVRATDKGSSESSSPTVLERLEKLFSPRTLRLLRNLDELEREVNDSSPPYGSRVSVLQE